MLFGFIDRLLAILWGPTFFIGLNVFAPRSLLLCDIFAFYISCLGIIAVLLTYVDEPVATLVIGWLLCFDPNTFAFRALVALVLLFETVVALAVG